ncbi:MAG: hypothetical protein V4667_09180 [Bacteroidota bacterium]
MKNKIIYTLLILALAFNTMQAASILDKKVNLVFNNITLEQALKQISDNYQVRFSYINNLVPLQSKVSLSIREKTLATALNKLFENTYVIYYAVGKHIVLKSASADVKPNATIAQNVRKYATPIKPIKPLDYSSSENLVADAELKMYDIDAKLRELDSLNLLESNTAKKDSLGKLRLQQSIAIQIDKIKALTQNLVDGFNSALDSLVAKDTANTVKINDALQKIEKQTVKLFVNVDNKVDSIVAEKKLQKIYSVVPDSNGYYHRPFQLTFFPPLGTNGIQSTKVINNASINLLIGANGGVNGFEGAGFMNVNKTDVFGIQGAGFGNVNGANTYGIQGAGFFNVTGNDIKGIQGAGFFNITGNNVSGVQGAGFFNVTGKNVTGVQGAGFFNVTGQNIIGVQGAGFFNVAENIKGFQGAGFFNVAENVDGVQASGFFNVAQKVKGTQIGFLNFADTIQGVPFGFLSFVKKGYHKIELSASEVLPLSASFRTGAKQFHNIIGVGINPFAKQTYVSVTYGVGTDVRLTSKIDLSIDVLAHDIRYLNSYPNNGISFQVNNCGQLRVNAVYAITKKVAVYAGPTYSVYVTDIFNKDTNAYGMGFEPYTFYDRARNGYSLKMWVGGSLGLRFL